MKLKLISIILISLSLIINETNCKNDQIAGFTKKHMRSHQKINHHLEWITNDTKFPIKLSVTINSEDLVNDSLSWDWLRLKDETLVTHLPTLFKDYLVTKTEKEANLFIMTYNHTTNEQLASYVPLLVYVDEEKNVLNAKNDNNPKDVFTLAYLEKHGIIVENTSENNHVSCYADFLVAKPSPDTSSRHTYFLKSVMNQMERESKFAMRYKQHGKSEPEDFQEKFNRITNSVPAFDDRLHDELLSSWLELPSDKLFNFFDNSDLKKMANFFAPPLPTYLPGSLQAKTTTKTTKVTPKRIPALARVPTPESDQSLLNFFDNSDLKKIANFFVPPLPTNHPGSLKARISTKEIPKPTPTLAQTETITSTSAVTETPILNEKPTETTKITRVNALESSQSLVDFFDNTDLEKMANFFVPPLPTNSLNSLKTKTTATTKSTTKTRKIISIRGTAPALGGSPPEQAQSLLNFFDSSDLKKIANFFVPPLPTNPLSSLKAKTTSKVQSTRIPSPEPSQPAQGLSTSQAFFQPKNVQPEFYYEQSQQPTTSQQPSFKNKVKTEMKLDFDSALFFKIRMSLEPISIKDKIQSIDSVECSLTLLGLGDSPYYLSTVNENIHDKSPAPEILNKTNSIDSKIHSSAVSSFQINMFFVMVYALISFIFYRL